MSLMRRRPMTLAWPFGGEFGTMFREMDRLMRGVVGRPEGHPEAEEWVPRMEIHQADDELIVRAELPGLTKEDIEVEATRDFLTIRGERQTKDEKCAPDGACATEFSYGRFVRTVAWPVEVDAEKIKATSCNGVLELRAPILEAAKPPEPKKVDID